MRDAFKLGETEYEVALSRSLEGYRLHRDGAVVDLTWALISHGRHRLGLGARTVEVWTASHGDTLFVHVDGEAYELRHQHPLDRLDTQAGGAANDEVRAPMPGSIVAVQVQPGDTVTLGQTLLVMESMKMETTISAPRDGVVHAVAYSKGQTFDRDAQLVSFEPQP